MWQICVYFFNYLLYLNGENALLKENTPTAVFSRQTGKVPPATNVFQWQCPGVRC